MLCALAVLLASVEIPHGRLASGTSWQPDATPMQMLHLMAGDWMLMLHGSASLGWDWQSGARGDRTAMSTDWLMLMASHDLWGGTLTLRGMASAEAATIPPHGFPQLLQSGEEYDGVHLHDRQHPHDVFMEVALDYRHDLTDWLGFELYGGPSGEPALGPVAFMHRASAQDDPFPPIGHHWQDSTHVTFGVVTAGFYTSDLKLEGSWFNGREPDQTRWNFDLRPFDSYSVRLTALPDDHVAVQVSYGYLASPEPPDLAGAEQGVSRVTASVQVSAGEIEASAIWGRNLEAEPLDSFLLEGRRSFGDNAFFGRLERVDKTSHDLSAPGDAVYAVHEVVLGAIHHFPPLWRVQLGLGARGSLSFVPAALASSYGGRVEPGAYLYLHAAIVSR